MTGNITSLNYPETYPDYEDCQYKIDLRSSGASSVTLTFTDFQTEIRYDFVYVNKPLSHKYFKLCVMMFFSASKRRFTKGYPLLARF